MSRSPKTSVDSHRETACIQQADKKYYMEQILSITLFFTPFALLSLLVLVFAYSLQITDTTFRTSVTYRTRAQLNDNTQTHPPPTVHEVLAQVTNGLDSGNVTYWLLPGLGLLPASQVAEHTRIDGKLSPWQEGVDIGVFQSDVLNVAEVQAELQADGIMVTESYYGLRLYPINGYGDERYDFKTPFVDIVYFMRDVDQIVSTCCDCGPISVSACTKKTCGCLPCSNHVDDIFPLSSVFIHGMNKALKGPKRKELLKLPTDLEGVHPGVFALPDGT